MTALNLKKLDPAQLMPIPEVPESYGPRNAEDRRVYKLVKEAFDADIWHTYETV
jgi:hypothetical protein